jgi:MFS family permease
LNQTTQRARLWTRDFSLLTISTFALFVSFYFLMPTLPIFVEESLGGDQRTIGLVSGIFTITAVSFRPLGGYLMDRLGRRGVHLLALGAFALAVLGYNLVTTLGLLLAVRLLHGLPWGVANTAANTVAADLVPPARRGEGMGLFGLGQTLAMAVGPLLAMLVLGTGRFHRVFAAGGMIAVAALFLASLVRHPVVRDPQARLRLSSLLERRVGMLSVVNAFVTAGYGSVTTFVVVFGADLGIPSPGMFFTMLAVGLVAARMTAGRIFDRRGPGRVVAVGILILSSGYLLLWWGRSGFYAAAVALGLGFGTVVPSLQAMAANLVPASRRGAAYATLLAGFDVGVGLGAFVLGYVAQAAGYPVMYLTAAGLLMVPMALFAWYVLPGYTRAVAKPASL